MNDGRTERKVIQGGLWGAVTIVIVWLAHVGLPFIGSVEIPTEVAQALTIIFSTGGAWLTK